MSGGINYYLLIGEPTPSRRDHCLSWCVCVLHINGGTSPRISIVSDALYSTAFSEYQHRGCPTFYNARRSATGPTASQVHKKSRSLFSLTSHIGLSYRYEFYDIFVRAVEALKL